MLLTSRCSTTFYRHFALVILGIKCASSPWKGMQIDEMSFDPGTYEGTELRRRFDILRSHLIPDYIQEIRRPLHASSLSAHAYKGLRCWFRFPLLVFDLIIFAF